jgi:hypothetical protein
MNPQLLLLLDMAITQTKAGDRAETEVAAALYTIKAAYIGGEMARVTALLQPLAITMMAELKAKAIAEQRGS